MNTTASSTTSVDGVDNWRSGLGLAVYLLVMVPIAFNFDFSIPLVKRWRIHLYLTSLPPLGVAILLATTAIDSSVFRIGIFGQDGQRPYDVLVLFLAFAYMATAIDQTDAFRAMAIAAFNATKRVGARAVFIGLFVIWMLTSLGVILSGTPFLVALLHILEESGLTRPGFDGWMFSQFIAANVGSAALVSSNPTNVLISEGFDRGYTSETIVPTLVTAVVAFVLAMVRWPGRGTIPKGINSKQTPNHDLVLSRALLHGGIFLSAVVIVVLSSYEIIPGAQVWMITGAAGLLATCCDITGDMAGWWPGPDTELWHLQKIRGQMQKSELRRLQKEKSGKGKESRQQGKTGTSLTFKERISRRLPLTTNTLQFVPFPLMPFAGGVFVLNQALVSLGWVSVFAKGLAAICTSPAVAVFFLGYFASVVMCPLCGTNIGATILLVQILNDKAFTGAAHIAADPRILYGAMQVTHERSVFSSAMATNLGAFSFAFSSSLAGLLWKGMLGREDPRRVRRRDKGLPIVVSWWEFMKGNALFIAVLPGVASGMVLVQANKIKV